MVAFLAHGLAQKQGLLYNSSMTNLDMVLGRSATYWILVATWRELRNIKQRLESMNREKLTEWISESKLSRKEAAEKLGIARSSLHNMLQGQYLPGLALATKIEKLTEGRIKASRWTS